MIGNSLGPYKIVEQLGAGGMGEVYLGEDIRLGRKVAIKVLPAEFAADPERRARFEQEARAAAALNHPHIAVVHDIGFELAGESAGDAPPLASDGRRVGTHYIVQEFLEGESLGQRLSGGTLRIERALDLAIEVGEALIAAHQSGIIHRDLKPDNIFVTVQGHAKVLDFGLAKLTEAAASASQSASMSPTLAGTAAGQILGTAGYMAPEQVHGEEIDHRADLFAFGCVLYGMVSGRQPFAGTNLHDTLGKIVDKDPEPLAGIDASLPAEVDRIVRKCLAKDRERRYQAAADLVVDLRALTGELKAGHAISLGAINQVSARAVGGRRGSGAASRGGIAVGWVATLLLLTAAATAVGVGWLGGLDREQARGNDLVAFDIMLPANMAFSYTGRHVVAVSPDGSEIVFAGDNQLRRRRLGDAEAIMPIGGTEAGGRSPFFSPDGTEVGFWIPGPGGGELRKVPLNGGLPIVLCVAANPSGATWLADGTILFGQGSEGIQRVSADGGDPEVVIAVGENQSAHGPQLLADGESILFTLRTGSGAWDDAQIVIGSLAGDEVEVLFSGGSDARYVAPGHIVYVRGETLMARTVDLTRFEVGEEFRLIEGIGRSLANLTGAGHFDVAGNGTLVYALGTASDVYTGLGPVVWIDQSLEVPAVPGDLETPAYPRLSPDGRSVAVQITDVAGENHIEIQELARGIWTRLTTDGDGRYPAWAHDSQSVYFTSTARDGEPTIYRRRIDLAGPAVRIWAPGGPGVVIPDSVSSDGRVMFVTTILDASVPEGWYVTLDEPARAERLFEGAPFRGHAQLHPSGQWVAYVEASQADVDVFVREFPDGRTWKVSPGGATSAEPLWSRDGSRLFYRSGAAMMAVDVQTEPDFRPAAPRELITRFIGPPVAVWPNAAGYDVASDGRFLSTLVGPVDATEFEAPKVRVVLNWLDELRRQLAAGS